MPVGPTGCEGNHAGRADSAWFLGASFGMFTSELRFSDGTEPDITEQSVVASGGYRWAGGWSARVAAGAVLGGTLEHGGRAHDVGAGWMAAAGLSRSFPLGERWFVSGNVTAGVSSTSTTEQQAGSMSEAVSLAAVDVRLGVLAGVTLWQRWSPYVLARGFGGPVLWTLDGEDITGSDQHHYQLGVGSTVALPWSLTLLVDASVVGERAVSLGLSAEL